MIIKLFNGQIKNLSNFDLGPDGINFIFPVGDRISNNVYYKHRGKTPLMLASTNFAKNSLAPKLVKFFLYKGANPLLQNTRNSRNTIQMINHFLCHRKVFTYLYNSIKRTIFLFAKNHKPVAKWQNNYMFLFKNDKSYRPNYNPCNKNTTTVVPTEDSDLEDSDLEDSEFKTTTTVIPTEEDLVESTTTTTIMPTQCYEDQRLCNIYKR